MFSAIIPCYNRAKTLGRAIQSVIEQGDYASQIIVVDDGSTDETKSVCARFEKKIEYVWQKNAGASIARNEGVRNARNAWVAFLDSDDYWLPSHLERIANAIKDTEGVAGFYFTDMQMSRVEGETTLWKVAGFTPPSPVQLVDDGTSWAFLRWQPMILQTSAFQKSLWVAERGLDPEFNLMHDTEFFFRLSIGRKICAVSGAGCVYGNDAANGRLTDEFNPNNIAYWTESISLWRSLMGRLRDSPRKYRVLARSSLASSIWRLSRLYWSHGNSVKAALLLPVVAWTDPRFALSLLRHRRSDLCRSSVVPEYS